MMSWPNLREITRAFARTKPVRITPAEYNSFFQSPVWSAIVRSLSEDIITRFDAIMDPRTTEQMRLDAIVYVVALTTFLRKEDVVKNHLQEKVSGEEQESRRAIQEILKSLNQLGMTK